MIPDAKMLKILITSLMVQMTCISSPLMAQKNAPIVIDPAVSFQDLNGLLFRFSDSTSSLGISDIQDIPDQMWNNQRLTGRSDAVEWIKFRFDNRSDQALEKTLYINNLYLLSIDVFVLNDSALVDLIATGLARSNEAKPYLDPMYPIQLVLPAYSVTTVYVRIDDPITAIHNDIFFLIDTKSAYRLHANRLLFSNIWLGILITAMIISMFLYMSVRSKMFLYYLLLSVSVALVIGTNVGFVTLILEQDPHQIVGNLYQLGAATMMIFMPRFLNCIVPIRSIQPIVWKAFSWLAYLGLVCAASYCLPFVKYHPSLGPLAISVLTLVSALIFFYLLVILGVAAFKKLKRAVTLFWIYAVYLSMALGIVILPHLGLDTNEIHSFLFLIAGSIFEIVAFLLLMARVTLDIYRDREQLSVQVQNNQKLMMEAVIKSQEDERKRYSADLHDGLGQMITALGLKIDSIESTNTNERKSLLDHSRSLLSDMYDELKNICFNLMPHTLITSGVSEALKEMTPRLGLGDKIKVHLHFFGMENRLSQAQEISIYRITQEWLNNVIKYSSAKRVDINLTRDEDELTLMIEDDGDGFDEALLVNGSGNGWKNIHSRADLIQGEISLDTMPGRRGTTFILNVPTSIVSIS